MTAISTPKLADSTDSFLRFALRADATASGLMGIAGIPLAGWLADASGTPIAFEYTVSALFIAFAVGVFALAARPSVKRPGIVIAAGNALYTVATRALCSRQRLPADHRRRGAHAGDRRLHAGHGRVAVPGLAPREGVSRCRSSPLGDPGRV